MTNILALPVAQFAMLIANNEDWLDTWPYEDAAGTAIPLDGLALNFVVRRGGCDGATCVVASTEPAVGGLPVSGAVIVYGAGRNVVALDIPRAKMRKILPGTYVHELQAFGDGYTRTIAQGSVQVTCGVAP